MPELPEVRWLVRNLQKAIGSKVEDLNLRRAESLQPTLRKGEPEESYNELIKIWFHNFTITRIENRLKYILFEFKKGSEQFVLLSHLGFTG